MLGKLIPFTALALAAALAGCSAHQQPAHSAVTADSAALPLTEIDQLLAEQRKRALDNPSTENLSNLNLMLQIREAALAKESAEKLRKERAPFGEKHRQVSRQNTLDWDNMGRGGAAMRQPGYVHTLSGYNEIKQPKPVIGNFGQKNSAASKAMIDKAMRTPIAFGEPNRPQSYSIYEMSRWERFCTDEGKTMDKRDWDFVKKEGANNLPQHLRDTCNPPKRVL